MAPQPRRRIKRIALFALSAGIVLVLAVFLLVYFVIFPTSSPKPFKLTTAVATDTSGTTTPTAQRLPATGLGGSWRIASGSLAGYRVREKLAFLPAESDAVGRTSQITGGATFTESRGTVTITSAAFQVAVDTLQSDRSMRDERIHEIGLESSRYPTATFVLSTPSTVPASALAGRVARVSVTGTFTIHGAPRKETLPVEMSVSGSTFEAVGSLTFPWSEFGMTAPSVAGFVNVTEHATMEFDLHMQRA